MKKIAVYGLFLVMFVVTGCPLQTKNSVDGGSYEVPSWLQGTWHEIGTSGKKNYGYHLKKDNKKGNLKCYNVDSAGKIDYQNARPVILSKVGDKIFLSAYERGDDMTEEGYYIFEFRRVSDQEFVLAALKEHAIDFDVSSAEIIKFLQQNKNSSGIYEATEVSRYQK